ncbi:hypothetical protein PIB30_011479 [Stylosanthes scabra]|uniref:DUF4283 domain-containing protein n=1 Tax=Stylosanthes scabra TaxID=79078 RepID=A0ABU6S6F5_9FABA|nr:hypothetical protein [Stylosanthes scabra]
MADSSLNEKLSRSLIGEALHPMDYDNKSRVVLKEWHTMTDAKMMGSHKMLMTFDSMENMMEAERSPAMLNHFMEVRRWTPQEANITRRMWLEVYELPANAWTTQNMEMIGGMWGAVIKMEAGARGHFNAFRIMVEANFAPTVQAYVKVNLDGKSYGIMVKEMRTMNNYPEEDQEVKRNGLNMETGDENGATNMALETIGGESKNESNSVT